jgi:hypothetical protein
VSPPPPTVSAPTADATTAAAALFDPAAFSALREKILTQNNARRAGCRTCRGAGGGGGRVTRPAGAEDA